MSTKNKNKNKTKNTVQLDAVAVPAVQPENSVNETLAAALDVQTGDLFPETLAPAEVEVAEDASEDRFVVVNGLRILKPTSTQFIANKAAQRVRMKERTRLTSGSGVIASDIVFPTDRFGLTKDMKKAMISMASRIAGSQEKMDLAQETLDLLVDFLHKKFAADAAYRENLAKRDA